MLGHRLVILRDLVALRQIGVEIILAGESRDSAHLAAQREGALDGQFHGFAAEDGKGAGKSEADRTHVGVGRCAEAGGTAAEDLGGRGQLDVDFESDYRLVAGADLRSGSPRQTGHTLVLGGAPKLVGQPQKILVAVASWTWTSSPITGS